MYCSFASIGHADIIWSYIIYYYYYYYYFVLYSFLSKSESHLTIPVLFARKCFSLLIEERISFSQYLDCHELGYHRKHGKEAKELHNFFTDHDV